MRQSLVWRALAALSVAVPLSIHAQAIPAAGHAAGGVTVPSLVHQGSLTPAEVARLAQHPTERVIIELNDQHSDVIDRGATRQQRQALVQSDQAPILAELTQVRAPRVQPFRLINAIAATVSSAEAARLASNPSVRAVVPDRWIAAPQYVKATAAVTASSVLTGTIPCSATTPSLEPEALQLTNTAFGDPKAPQAQSIVTGTGVTVAFIADGLDINNPEFIRPGGGHVFVDYQDFSGDGPNAPTGGGEAFGDASSIAAQGNLIYDLNKFVNAAHRLPGNVTCPIKVRGMAPGVSLMGLNVFGSLGGAFNSTTVQAVEYAVEHGADVINESLGLNTYPDNNNDPLQLANDAAVAAGVAVTASSGDAGTASTLGAPATDPNVISVGASTQFREYVQTVRYGTQLESLIGGNNGWMSNNISSFSSSGVSEAGRQTVDLVMPGDSSYEACTPDTNLYADCTNFNNDPSNLGFFAGTSESAPLAAGEIALIIQAYRLAHGGSSPSPAVIKQILLGTATDLGIPGYEQGAGLGNSLKAVKAAAQYGLAVSNSVAISPAGSAALLASKTLLSAEGAPGTAENFPLQLTNDGTISQTVVPYVRSLAAPFYSASFTPSLDPTSDPAFIDHVGKTEYYVRQDFTVPSGAQRLDAAISWDDAVAQPHALVRLVLFDPQGRFTAFTYPDNPAPFTTQRYGHVDVRFPVAGTWHAFITTRAGSTVYTGPVHFDVSASKFTIGGAVTPSSCSLAPGASCMVTVTTHIPLISGDQTQEVGFTGIDANGSKVSAGAIPIILRSLVSIGPKGGIFTGILTGGNGRGGAPAQELTYDFNVPAGQSDLDLSVGITDTNYNLVGFLVDPNGQPLDIQSTVTSLGPPPTFVPQTYTNALQFFWRNPQPGRWRFILVLNLTASGNQTALPFLGTITFNGASVLASGVPNDPAITLPASRPTTAQVTITNTGVVTEGYFIDSRLTQTGPLFLGSASTALRTGPTFYVPTESTRLDVVGESVAPSIPINLELQNSNGTTPFGFTSAPDILGTPFLDPFTGNFAALATASAPELGPGFWAGIPVGIGPFSAPAPSTTVDVGAEAITKLFDPAVTSSTGDPIANLAGVSASPNTFLTLGPGQSGTILVRIAPSAPSGTTVSGYLFVDTLAVDMASNVLITNVGDEVAAVPYAYTVQ